MGRRCQRGVLLCVLCLLAGLHALSGAAAAPVEPPCEAWIDPDGDDGQDGTRGAPWATLEHAAEQVPDRACTIWLAPGLYEGSTRIVRRFKTPTLFRAVEPYRSVLEADHTVLHLSGAANVTFEGLRLRHSGPGATGYVAIADRKGDTWAEHVTFKNNVFHDSFDNDLLKLHNGVRHARVTGNLFYNQGDGEQHLDINSVSDIYVEDNILFNEFEASRRPNNRSTKHFIIVKDSNQDSDGLVGATDVTIRRNVFLNWQGRPESFIGIGNDGKPYHEAVRVRVLNNLLIGNADDPVDTSFSVRGARDVQIVNNTVVGNLPSKWFAYRVHVKDQNPQNQDIVFANNIWADPTATMAAEAEEGRSGLARNDPAETVNLVHSHNMYWNGGADIPPGRILRPLVEDLNRLVADPGLAADHYGLQLPHMRDGRFASGSRNIRQEHRRLIEAYGALPPSSVAVDAADPDYAPRDDIRGHRRGTPDVGAYEAADRSAAVTAVDGDEGSGVALVLVALLLATIALTGWAVRRRLVAGQAPARPSLRLVGERSHLAEADHLVDDARRRR